MRLEEEIEEAMEREREELFADRYEEWYYNSASYLFLLDSAFPGRGGL